MSNNDDRVPIFMPALSAVLLHAEDEKGEPLTFDEAMRIRDASNCILMAPDRAEEMAASRGPDVDPENLWYDWQMLRRELGRKPDLDPGPRLNQIRSSDPAYQQTILDAHATLGRFRELLGVDGSSRTDAMVKTEVTEGDHRAFMWLSNVEMTEAGFLAEFFEAFEGFSYQVGDALEIAEQDVLDWMVNDNGVLYGGFSIRYYRSTLPKDELAEYDAYIGVERYA